MTDIVLASSNAGKVREINPLLAGVDGNVRPQSDFGVADTDETGHFMTLFYVEISPGEKTLHWVRAGHDPALYYDPATDQFEELRGNGMALGIDSQLKYEKNEIKGLSNGQIIMLGTDGLWETQNEKGEMFGKERLQTLLRHHARLTAEEILASIIHTVKKFQQSMKQEDDITLVIVKIEDPAQK